MVTINNRKKLLFTIGLICLSCPAFGMEKEKENSTIHRSNSLPSTPQQYKYTKKSNSFTFGNFLKSSEEIEAEKIKKFNSEIKNEFTLMEAIEKPKDLLEFLRFGVSLGNKNCEIVRENDIPSSELSSINILDQLWNNESVSCFLNNVEDLKKVDEKALELLALSAMVVYKLAHPEAHHTNGHTNGRMNANNPFLTAACLCYSLLTQKCPHNPKYHFHAAKCLTENTKYEEAWCSVNTCILLSRFIENIHHSALAWLKQLWDGYSRFLKKSKDLHSQAKGYLEIAQLIEKMNAIENVKSGQGGKDSPDEEVVAYYLDCAACYEKILHQSSYEITRNWKAELLYPLACSASQRLKDGPADGIQLKTIANSCFELLKALADKTKGREALFQVAEMYQNGIGVELIDPKQALFYYEYAVNQGNNEALLKAGDLYANNYSNLPDAEKYYKKAADIGDSLAQYKLAKLYESKNNIKDALIYYEASGKQGNGDAQYRLGDIYSDKEKGYFNEEEAAKWYQAAADNGNLNAQVKTAERYRNVAKDNGLAIKYYAMAAKQNDKDKDIAFCLAKLYEEINLGGDATKWYIVASDNGHETAEECRIRIKKKTDEARSPKKFKRSGSESKEQIKSAEQQAINQDTCDAEQVDSFEKPLDPLEADLEKEIEDQKIFEEIKSDINLKKSVNSL